MNPVLAGRMAAYRRSFEKEQGITSFSLDAVLFPPQLAVVNSPSKRKVTRLARRTGKTTLAAGILLDGGVKPPHANQGYVTISLKQAKRLVWPVLKQWNRIHNLGGVPNETEGFMRFPHQPDEPTIYLGGLNDKEEIDKLRGWAGGVKRWILDEVQAIRTLYLQEAIDEVIEPASFDYDGELLVFGTPGPIKAGYFYDIDVGDKREGWDHFGWKITDNPWLEKKSGKPTEQMLEELLARRKWTRDNPTFRREYMGEWVEDPGALMLHYDRIRNGCEWQKEPVKGWTYVLGGDLGYEDSDALTVQGWAPNSRKVQKVAEYVRAKQGITELGNATRVLYDIWHPIAMPFDFGGLGKKIAIELQQRWLLPLEAAEKERKAEHVMLLDDAMIRGDYLAPPDSRFAQDCQIMQWDQEARAKGIWREDPAHHSDIMDADLYTFRKCWAYLERDAVPKPKVGTPEAFAAQERQMLQDRIEQMNRKREDPWYEQLAGDDE